MFANYRKKNKPQKRVSILEQYREGILDMRKEGYTLKQIRAALISEYRVTTTIQNISFFCKKITKRKKDILTSNTVTNNSKPAAATQSKKSSSMTKRKEDIKLTAPVTPEDRFRGRYKQYFDKVRRLTEEEYRALKLDEQVFYLYKMLFIGDIEELEKFRNLEKITSAIKTEFDFGKTDVSVLIDYKNKFERELGIY